jgi:hypothetical protein
MPDLTESISVAASPATLYSLVSDLPRMGEWSPECTRVTWSVLGERFIGHNRVGVVRWITFGRVVAAEPGLRFAFTIHFGPIPISLWEYDFAATPGGCQVTESWTDHRPAGLRHVFRPILGDRVPRNLEGIHTTLTRLKSTAESVLRQE